MSDLEKIKKMMYKLNKSELFEIANVAFTIAEYLESKEVAG